MIKLPSSVGSHMAYKVNPCAESAEREQVQVCTECQGSSLPCLHSFHLTSMVAFWGVLIRSLSSLLLALYHFQVATSLTFGLYLQLSGHL